MADFSIMGWRQDVGAKGQDYAMTGTMLWLGVMSGEPFVSVTRQTVELMTGRSAGPPFPYRQDVVVYHGHLDCCALLFL